MAKIQIKSDKITPFGGIFSIMEHFDALLSQTIDSVLGLHCKSYGYQHSEIIRSLMCVYFCGGSCIEELSQENITSKSDSGKCYEFNPADKLNKLLITALVSTKQLKRGCVYDMDFDHQFIETEKHDAKATFKKFLGYDPCIAVIGDKIVGIENGDRKANVRFHQQDTLLRMFERFP